MWRCLVVGWGLLAIVDFVDRLLSFELLAAAVLLTGITYPMVVLISIGLGRAYERAFDDARLNVPKATIILGLCVAAALCVVTTITIIRIALGWSMLGARPLEEFVIPTGHYAIAFLAWSILYFWLVTEADRQREQQHKVQAQLAALRAEIHELQLQLDPHFLFNALNGLAEEIPDHPERALAMAHDLTVYMRHVLASLRTPVVTVRSETEGLSAYLRIQQARFGDRVTIDLLVDPAAAERPIANLLIQPLIENAFEHGDRSARLDVSIRVNGEDGALSIEIANTGWLAMKTKVRPDHGLGLQNVRRRLEVQYPGRHQFVLEQMGDDSDPSQGGSVVAKLRLEGEPCSVP